MWCGLPQQPRHRPGRRPLRASLKRGRRLGDSRGGAYSNGRQLPTRGRPDRRATLLACLVRGLARAEQRLSGAAISHGARRGGKALVAGHEYRSL